MNNLVISPDGVYTFNSDIYESASYTIKDNGVLEFRGYKPVSRRAEAFITDPTLLDMVESQSILHQKDAKNTPFIPVGQWYIY